VNAAAIAIGVTRAALANLIHEKAAVSPEMALRLGKFFGNGKGIQGRPQAAQTDPSG